jgi:predicted ATPase/DNA-binding CsgD family transcriptional regulator
MMPLPRDYAGGRPTGWRGWRQPRRGTLGLVATQTLIFLFADIDDSAAISRRLGDGFAGLLADYHQLIRTTLAAHGGTEIVSHGDEVSAVFTSPRACADAAIAAQRALISHAWPGGEPVRARMGIDASEAAWGAAAAHGGQVVVSAAAAGLLQGSLPAGSWLKDLGLHRLKDGGPAEQIFQLQAEGLPAAFPPQSPDSPKLLSNLPAHVSSFIGRDGALAQVRAQVAGSRLVTLTGAGGAGKTRLALQVAASLLDGTGDGVWFADLAPLRDPDLVAVTVAGVLGVRLDPGRPVLEALVEAVAERRLLLLLDNCEHVIGACAKLADALLRGCPEVALMATSREPLGIDGERVYRVPSMTVPAEGADAEAVWASEAVRLLADRAAAQGVPLARDERTAQVAGRICRRLDGIPLAIELAAARLRVMPARELEARLDERFSLLTGGSRVALPRQQTLRAMADWSWELLTGAERQVLARLSVFAGGFTLAAAEAVAASPELPAWEVVGHLGALVDKSLVQFGDTGAGPGRYRLLETIRQYAAGQLDALGRAAADAARTTHRDYYLSLAEAAAPHLHAADQAEWLDVLDAELGNLRAAIAFSLTQPDPEPGLRLASSLGTYWKIRGHAAEAGVVLRALLDRPAAQAPTLPRARALLAAADLVEQTGEYAAADGYSEEGLAIARAAGDAHLTADLLDEQAWLLLRQGQPGAMALIESGLGLARRLGDTPLTAKLLRDRAIATLAEGDPAGAARDAGQAVQLFRRIGDRLQIGAMLGNLGYYEMQAGDLDAAHRDLTEALSVARELNDRSGITHQTFNLGLAEYLAGSPDTAQTLFTESIDLARRTGKRSSTAYALIGLALAGHRGTDPGWSARVHGAADQALADLGHTLEPLESQVADCDRQRLRAALGDEAFEAEYAVGRCLSAADVLATLEPQMPADRGGGLVSEPDAAAPAGAASVLTARELDVLKLVAQGLSNTDIAERLVLSDHTVHRHLANIMRKLGLSSRAAAAAWGVRTGLV